MGIVKFLRCQAAEQAPSRRPRWSGERSRGSRGASRWWLEKAGSAPCTWGVCPSAGRLRRCRGRQSPLRRRRAAQPGLQAELDLLLRLKHENIVRILGYCDDADQGALIFEYVSGGTLYERLHGRSGNKRSTLPWKSRVKIAFQLAQAIEYLHERCIVHIIHGDIKSSNVLLDGDSNCKLCDFGSAKMGFSSMILPPSSLPSSSPYVRRKNIIMGSPGYTDPAYLRTGIASKKNDIYSFGVLVLELVTAHMAKDVDRMDVSEVTNMVDPRLRGDFNVEEARALIGLARLCFDESTLVRPTASCMMKMMKEKVSSISFMNSNLRHKLSNDL
ncbi:probable receptor-like protein kinase At4g10390 [Eucalyptus grandis]|uniref:probable receptor-like protein kinase At4g10390 n=1 Tax=Eucalyptus grandis TaxID=71139 RepID=UPI00192EA04F|nr:probable receptor-like protein kinase At4g10390 [Eucalyptus grandis]